MSKQANPTIIGVFVLGAVLIALLGITVFTSDQWLTGKSRYVIYFNESVNGLSVGALVKMQGVQIGKVTDIKVELDPATKQILTPVFIEIDHEKSKQLLQLKDPDTEKMAMEQLIKDGLRMQLQYTSLVTGQLYIESLLRPSSLATLTGINKEFTELPAITSSAQEAQKNITDALREFRHIDFQELFSETLITIKNIKQLTGSDETKQSMYALSASLTELQGILTTFNKHSVAIAVDAEKILQHSSSAMQKLDNVTDPLLADIQQTIANTNLTLQQFQMSAKNVGDVFNKDAQLQRNLNSALIELRRSAKSLHSLADYLEMHPESILQGKKR